MSAMLSSSQRLAIAGCLAIFLCGLGACGGNSTLSSSGEPAGLGSLNLSLTEVLAELDNLDCPPAAEPGEFVALKETLRSALLARDVGRFTSAAPEDQLSAVSDFEMMTGDPGTAELAWTYRNTGDYNQDKLVAVNDLTPVGVHFQVGSADPTWNVAQVADGNNDGLVTVSDITPIGQNYLRRVEGYRIYSGDFAGDLKNLVASVAFEQSTIPVDELRRFGYTLAAPVDGMFYCVVPYDGGHLGIPSNSVQYAEQIGEAPVISAVAPLSGETGTEVTFSAIVTGTPPLTYAWDFGGGAGPNESTDISPQVTLGAVGSYDATLTVSNAEGDDSYPFTLGVYSGDNSPPVIDDAVYDIATRTLTVTVSDADAVDMVTVAVTEPEGLFVDVTDQLCSGGGPYTVEFIWTAEEMFVGASGETTITAEDTPGAVDSTTAEITVHAITLAADTLYAIPERAGALVGEDVRIVVATGTPASPFHYLNMVSVTVAEDAAYVNGSFNSGAVGGDAGDVDGYWAEMDPVPSVMLIPVEMFIDAVDIGAGLRRWEFTLAPLLAADETAAEGELFNFLLSFDMPGTYTLGFQQETGEVKRSYYSDQAENEYFWGDISNDHENFANSIIVY